MNLEVGIVGLPNVGKSTLFNALLQKAAAPTANFAFTTIEPNVGVVAVPDDRLAKLAKVVHTGVLIPASVRFVDIAGLVKGASEGEGLGNKFLSHIREVDAIVHLVRDFSDPEVVRVGQSPEEDIEIVNTELILADLETMQKLILDSEKQTKAGSDAHLTSRIEGLAKIYDGLKKGVLAIDTPLSDTEREAVGVLPLLTAKPQEIVFNVDENKLSGDGIRISAKLEAELSELTHEESEEYLAQLGVTESGLSRLITKMYQTLGLISFFTAGEKEVRAWTIRLGTKAPGAAGTIHTDFEKGFIKADVVSWEKLVEAGGWNEARAKGWVGLEGKDYIFKDGDVTIFRHA